MEKYTLSENQLVSLLEHSMNMGMDLRQKQLLGGLSHNKSGKELLAEWFESMKYNLRNSNNFSQ